MKLRTVLAFAAGYVLGARAGRDRYEQMRRAYRRATSNEHVRQVLDQGKARLAAHAMRLSGTLLLPAGPAVW